MQSSNFDPIFEYYIKFHICAQLTLTQIAMRISRSIFFSKIRNTTKFEYLDPNPTHIHDRCVTLQLRQCESRAYSNGRGTGPRASGYMLHHGRHKTRSEGSDDDGDGDDAPEDAEGSALGRGFGPKWSFARICRCLEFFRCVFFFQIGRG